MSDDTAEKTTLDNILTVLIGIKKELEVVNENLVINNKNLGLIYKRL